MIEEDDNIKREKSNEREILSEMLMNFFYSAIKITTQIPKSMSRRLKGAANWSPMKI